MRPPICAVCKEFALNEDKKSGLISFALTEEQQQSNEKFKEPGFVGHPLGKEWFCGNHYEAAKKLNHLSSSEAIKILKESQG